MRTKLIAKISTVAVACWAIFAAFLWLDSVGPGAAKVFAAIFTIGVAVGIWVGSFGLMYLGGHIVKGNKAAFRVGVVISVFWALTAFVLIEPYTRSRRSDAWTEFILCCLPVVAYWGIIWIAAGFLSQRKDAGCAASSSKKPEAGKTKAPSVQHRRGWRLCVPVLAVAIAAGGVAFLVVDVYDGLMAAQAAKQPKVMSREKMMLVLASRPELYGETVQRRNVQTLWLIPKETRKNNSESCRRVVEENPDDSLAWDAAGECYARWGFDEEAIGAYKEAIRIDSEFVEAQYHLGAACAKLGRSQEAIEAYKQTIRIMPTHIEARYELSEEYAVIKRYDEAVQVLKDAIRVQPENAEAYWRLGKYYIRLFRHKEAVAAYKEAIRLDPEYAVAHYNGSSG